MPTHLCSGEPCAPRALLTTRRAFAMPVAPRESSRDDPLGGAGFAHPSRFVHAAASDIGSVAPALVARRARFGDVFNGPMHCISFTQF